MPRHMKNFLLIVIACGLSCQNSPTKPKRPTLSTPTCRMAVFSDPHLLAPALMAPAGSETDYAARKLIAQSHAILSAVIDQLITDPVDLVLIPGDLTKDGEAASHRLMALMLSALESQSGATVLVVPGNHDVNNARAADYSSGQAAPTETVNADAFATLYHEFGYGEALSRDSLSLSYAARPIEGLRIIAVDSNADPRGKGRLSAATQQWIEEQLNVARDVGDRVFMMMHHGLIEHFKGQGLFFQGYLIKKREALTESWRARGCEVVFTGHFHAMDAAAQSAAAGVITDIETGSLVTYPCAYRKLQLTDGQHLQGQSVQITQIDQWTSHEAFQDYALHSIHADAKAMLQTTEIRNTVQGHLLEDDFYRHMANLISNHYMGDERHNSEWSSFVASFNQTATLSQKLLISGMGTLTKDIAPEDNNVSLILCANPYSGVGSLKNSK